MSTSPFLAEANKLKNIQINLERNEALLLEHIAKHFDARIAEYCKDLEVSRTKEIDASRQEIRNLFVLLNNIKETINGRLDDIDFKLLKKNMELMQTSIRELKQKLVVNLNELHKSEVELSKEIKAYEVKMHEWGKFSNPTPNIFKEHEIINKKIDQRVADFLTFVAKSGGHENGWNVEDHNLFLKIKAKCKSEQEIAQHLHAILPDISEEEVIAHDKWYTKYLELKTKHREAIKKWRLSKSAPKLKDVEKDTCRNQRRPVTSISMENLSRKEVKEKLEVWKEEKKQKLKSEKELVRQEKLQKKLLEEKRKQKYVHLRETVQDWRSANAERKQAEFFEKFMMEQKIKEFKSAMANRLIKEFQSQDDILMKRRKENLKPKIKAEARCNTSVIMPRDPSRLFKPTKQWILRTRDEENGEKTKKNVCSIKHIPKLGVPEWRRQLVL